jgi:hypothetical protein
MLRSLLCSITAAALLMLSLAGASHAQTSGHTGPTGPDGGKPAAAQKLDEDQLESLLRTYDNDLRVNKQHRDCPSYRLKLQRGGAERRVTVLFNKTTGRIEVCEALTREDLTHEQKESARNRIATAHQVSEPDASGKVPIGRLVLLPVDLDQKLGGFGIIKLVNMASEEEFQASFTQFLDEVAPIVDTVKDLR